MKYLTYPIARLKTYQERYGFNLTVEDSTGFCARIEKDGACHLVSGSDLGLNSSAAQRVSADKCFTDFFLNRDGIPTIATLKLRKKSDLERVAGLAFPAILKPNTGHSGNGVVLVRGPEEALAAFDYVQGFSEIVLAQEYVDKREFRLVTLDGIVYFCYQRMPFVIEGDGEKSIARFLAERNEGLPEQQKIDPHDFRIGCSLKSSNLQLDSVPEKGRRVRLFVNSNLKCGGSWRDVTPLVHPGYLSLAGRCARSLGLRIAGIDIFADSIESFDPGCRVIEVNSRPGFEYVKENQQMTDRFFDRVVAIIVEEYLKT